MDIAEWRKQIDTVDQQLVALLNQRCRCAMAIGGLKQAQGLPITEQEREERVLANIRAANRDCSGPIDDAALERVFTCIMAEMRRLQATGS